MRTAASDVVGLAASRADDVLKESHSNLARHTSCGGNEGAAPTKNCQRRRSSAEVLLGDKGSPLDVPALLEPLAAAASPQAERPSRQRRASLGTIPRDQAVALAAASDALAVATLPSRGSRGLMQQKGSIDEVGVLLQQGRGLPGLDAGYVSAVVVPGTKGKTTISGQLPNVTALEMQTSSPLPAPTAREASKATVTSPRLPLHSHFATSDSESLSGERVCLPGAIRADAEQVLGEVIKGQDGAEAKAAEGADATGDGYSGVGSLPPRGSLCSGSLIQMAVSLPRVHSLARARNSFIVRGQALAHQKDRHHNSDAGSPGLETGSAQMEDERGETDSGDASANTGRNYEHAPCSSNAAADNDFGCDGNSHSAAAEDGEPDETLGGDRSSCVVGGDLNLENTTVVPVDRPSAGREDWARSRSLMPAPASAEMTGPATQQVQLAAEVGWRNSPKGPADAAGAELPPRGRGSRGRRLSNATDYARGEERRRLVGMYDYSEIKERQPEIKVRYSAKMKKNSSTCAIL